MGDQIEEALLADYVATKVRGKPYDTHLRLGWPPDVDRASPDALRQRNYRLPALPAADLVVREDGGARIYEFSIWRPITKVGQLLGYRILLPETPGYADLRVDAVMMRIVVGVDDYFGTRVAKYYGVELEEYLPPEIAAMITARRGRRPVPPPAGAP